MTTEDTVATKPHSSEAVLEIPVEVPVDPRPKNVDALTQSTARFSRKAWDVFLSLKEDL
jgi:hypothetical protein